MVKSVPFFAILFLTGYAGFAQAANQADTTTRYVDIAGRIQPRETAAYVQKTWPQNGKYQLELRTNDTEGRLVRKTSYADEKLQVLEGPFEEFHANGQLREIGNYSQKKRNGLFKSWYENGNLMAVYQYADDIRIDTGKAFYDNGVLSLLAIMDKTGTGTETNFYLDGSVKMRGPLEKGRKSGTWILVRENGTKKMQIEFIRDSIAQTTCFAEDGQTLAEGPCIFERFARFPGGTEGWRNFLMKNLNYPKKAIQNDIEGTVMLEFTIDTTGTPGEIKVLYSPNELLTAEALRLLKISPKWEPAIQYNRPVKGRLRQPIYFRLQ